MKVVKYGIVIGAAVLAVSANAQFGAASKSALEPTAGSQGLYLQYSPFARISGGGNTGNGYLVGAEKAISSGQRGPGILGGFFSRIDGANLYQFSYRQYIQEDASVQFGILGGDGFNGKNDFSFLYFKDMPSTGTTPINWQLFGGVTYDSSDEGFNLSGGVKASYPLSNGFAIDGTFWYLSRGGSSGNFISIGVSYKI